MKKVIFLLIGATLLLSSCRKDIDDPIINPPIITVDPGILIDYEPTVIPMTGSVDGFVTDENGDAVQGAQIRLGNQTTVTNEDGHFALLSVDMNEAGTLIQVTQNGYFDGSRRFIPTGNGVDRVRVQLLQKTFDQSFDSSGGTVSIPGSTGSIDFPANSIVDANGAAYSGTVDIAVKYLDPSAQITSEQMPGDLFGVNEDLEEQVLATYGMVAVELVDNNGNPLNLGENSTATIKMPVPASMQANAPATIPLWSYNEEYGVWVEEGEATLTNGVYIGEVTHFSWWNCDIPTVYTNLTATVLDQNGNPIAGMGVLLTSTNFGTGYGITNSNGIVSGIIPAGEGLVAEVVERNCNTTFHTQNIGPFTQNSTITLNVTIPSTSVTTVIGTAECNGLPLNDNVLVVKEGNNVEYIYNTTPNLIWSAIYCGQTTNYTAKVVNIATNEESNNIPVVAGVVNNIGTVDACQNQLTNMININIDGTGYLFTPGNISITPDWSTIGGYTSNQESVTFALKGSSTGSFPNQLNSIGVSIYPGGQWTTYSGELSVFDVTISGTKLSGTIGGTITNSTNGPAQVSGSFDIDLCEPVTEFTGTAGCAGAPISDLMAKIDLNGQLAYYDVADLDFGLLKCTPNLPYELTIIDKNSLTQSNPITGTTGTANNLGNIDACQSPVSEFISLDIDGVNNLLYIVNDSLGLGATRVSGSPGYNFSNLYFDLEFMGNSSGSYPNAQNQVSLYYNSKSYYGSLTAVDITTFNSTDIIGSFSGVLTDNNGNSVTVSGTFDSDL